MFPTRHRLPPWQITQLRESILLDYREGRRQLLPTPNVPLCMQTKLYLESTDKYTKEMPIMFLDKQRLLTEMDVYDIPCDYDRMHEDFLHEQVEMTIRHIEQVDWRFAEDMKHEPANAKPHPVISPPNPIIDADMRQNWADNVPFDPSRLVCSTERVQRHGLSPISKDIAPSNCVRDVEQDAEDAELYFLFGEQPDGLRRAF